MDIEMAFYEHYHEVNIVTAFWHKMKVAFWLARWQSVTCSMDSSVLAEEKEFSIFETFKHVSLKFHSGIGTLEMHEVKRNKILFIIRERDGILRLHNLKVKT